MEIGHVLYCVYGRGLYCIVIMLDLAFLFDF